MRRKRASLEGDDPPIETPEQLGERYWRELNELIDQGEISRSLARRVMDDMFIPAEAGQPPRLRLRFWRDYAAQLIGEYD